LPARNLADGFLELLAEGGGDLLLVGLIGARGPLHQHGDLGQGLLQLLAGGLPLLPELQEPALGDPGPVRAEGATLPASWLRMPSIEPAPPLS
jgi:hypothetical protein